MAGDLYESLLNVPKFSKFVVYKFVFELYFVFIWLSWKRIEKLDENDIFLVEGMVGSMSNEYVKFSSSSKLAKYGLKL